MKKPTLVKSLIALTLALTMCVPMFVGCNSESDKPADGTTTEAPEAPKVPEYDGDFEKPKDSDQKVSEGNYIKVTDVEAKYLKTSGNDVLVNVLAPQFAIGGITHPNETQKKEFYRLDASKKATYSTANNSRAEQTSGVTVRFRTNAPYILLNATMRNCTTTYQHFADRGAFGFDVYVGTGTNRVYLDGQGLLTNSNAIKNQKLTLPGGFQEVTINLPLYGGVASLQVGFPKDAMIAPPTDRDYGTICFYGSSITQGGCVTRPGNSYSNIICRMLNADNMNLGFSGSALGEQAVAEYIASRDIAAFVMDYDYNNTVAGLRDTHYAFYETVRKAHPDIPIIMVSRPTYHYKDSAEELERQSIIKSSYNKAVKNGDENVYYVCGSDFFLSEMPDIYAVDMCHPNDLGHYCMAKTIFPVLKAALDKVNSEG